MSGERNTNAGQLALIAAIIAGLWWFMGQFA
jgi:hypothetical protein